MKHYVVVGASAAGITAVGALRKLDGDARITLVSADEHIYSRVMLPLYLSGEKTLEGIGFVPPDYIEQNRVEWKRGVRATGLNASRRVLSTQEGDIEFDELLLATGAEGLLPSAEGVPGHGVLALRDLPSARAILAQLDGPVVVLGGGLTGLDAAAAFLHRGISVTVVDTAPHVLASQLCAKDAQRFADRFADKGAQLRTGASLAAVLRGGEGEVRGVRLQGGEEIPCGLVVVTAGVRPCTAWIGDPGVEVQRGVCVDEGCRTSAPHVYAAGDAIGKAMIWTFARSSGQVAAANMAGRDERLPAGTPRRNNMTYFGLSAMSAGEARVPEGGNEFYEETAAGSRRAVLKDGVLLGFSLVGDVAKGQALLSLLGAHVDDKAPFSRV